MRAPAPPVAPPRPGRRSVLAGALALGALLLPGCGVRLEDDAPAIPLIPTRPPIPAETALLWLLADCERLSAATAMATPPEPGFEPSAVYAEQAAVLRSALHRAGIPGTTLDETLAAAAAPPTAAPASTPASSAAPTTSMPTTVTPTTAVSAETPAGPAAALDRIEDLSGCGPGLFPLVMSLLAQRWAAVTLASDTLPMALVAGHSQRIWRFPGLARAFAELTGPAVYGLEVVAAQVAAGSRDSAESALGSLRLLAREQDARAGGSTPPPAVGYPLPFPVDSEESAAALATEVLGTLADGYGGLLPTVTGSAQEDTARDVVTWLGSAAALGAGWGLPLQAFPGTRPGS